MGMVHAHQSSGVTGAFVSEEECFERNLFSERSVLTVGFMSSVDCVGSRRAVIQALLFVYTAQAE